MADSGLQKSTVPFNLLEFLTEVDDHFKADNFSDDQDDIISSAPEMNDSAIHHLYAPLGGGKEKKSMRESLEKSCEQNGAIFHAVALLQHTTLLVTKQAASLRKDQTTRKETGEGEKPLPSEEYMCTSWRPRGRQWSHMAMNWASSQGPYARGAPALLAAACVSTRAWHCGRSCTTGGPVDQRTNHAQLRSVAGCEARRNDATMSLGRFQR